MSKPICKMMISEKKSLKQKKDKERGKRELVPQYCFSKKCLSVSKSLSYNINLVLKKNLFVINSSMVYNFSWGYYSAVF